MESAKCLSRLQRLCSRAEYCRQDMYRKALKDMEGDADAAERIVAQLVAERYVDDARYAAAFAREKSSLQGWGAVKIRFQLKGKGIADEAIETKFGSFLNSQVLSAVQLDLMRQIVTYARTNGDVTFQDLLRTSPFSDIDFAGTFGSNISYVQQLVNGLHRPVM